MSAVTVTAKSTATTATPKGKNKGKTVSAPVSLFQIKYAVEDFARPKAGSMLAAHTAAFLTLSGMADAPVPRAQCTRVIGSRAIAYHLTNGNFQATDKGLTLTPKGEEFFMSRSVDPEIFAAYMDVLTKGTINPAANVKTAGSIIKL